MRRGALFILAFVVAAAFFNLCPDQAPRAQGGQQSFGGTDLFNITGTVIREPDGYYVQGETPREIFRILNPIPNRLKKIAKTGGLVEIEAWIVQGDNINIEKIDGKPYRKK